MNKYKNPALILLVACLSLAIGFQGWLAVSSKFGSKVEAFAIIFLILFYSKIFYNNFFDYL